MVELINGGVYERRSYRRFVLIFMGHKEIDGEFITLWGMLHIHRHAVPGMSCTMFQHGGKGGYLFTEKELEEDFDLKNWEFLDGRLCIEKIDESSFVEYTINGPLEPIEKSVVYPALVKNIEFHNSLEKEKKC